MATTSLPAILELSRKSEVDSIISDFYDPVKPASFPKALLRYKNEAATQSIGLKLTDVEWQKYFHRFEAYPGNLPQPLALRYHGHQFRHYNPDLGDGRGFLYAQFMGQDHKLYDLGTKGSGLTPYSRGGDGRLTLKGAVREILATEMLESLGVNTSKTFCVFETGESLQRNDEPSPTRSAVLTRLSHSHLRIGTFQRLATLGQNENILRLIDYSVKNYFPELLLRAPESSPELAALFFRQVSENLAHLAAQYMLAGFVHGVLNSDNMNITGESFDYGPYRFLPTYDIHFTAAYFDHSGLYCYGRQPTAIHWNVLQLGRALQAAHHELPVEEILKDFGDLFSDKCRELFLQRLNLVPKNSDTDQALMNEYFQLMQTTQVPFEQVFFDLHSGINEERLKHSPLFEIYASENFKNLKELLLDREIQNLKLAQHPYFQQSKPCTLLIDEIENIWAPIAKSDDWSIFSAKIDQIRSFRGIYRLY